MSTRGARKAKQRLAECPVCRATGSEMHHPACPNGRDPLKENAWLYCSCGERWTTFHNCEAAK